MECPICKKQVESYYESSVREPFSHYHPLIGLEIYGAFSTEKVILCQNEDYLHFQFVGGEDRLVKLGCDIDDYGEKTENVPAVDYDLINEPPVYDDGDLPF